MEELQQKETACQTISNGQIVNGLSPLESAKCLLTIAQFLGFPLTIMDDENIPPVSKFMPSKKGFTRTLVISLFSIAGNGRVLFKIK